MDKKDALKLFLSIIFSLSAGAIGSFFTIDGVQNWYPALNKPWFTPPDWVFSPIWITLYVLMGVSLFLVWREGFDKKQVKKGVSVFAVQLVLNALWSILFFGLRSPLLGLIGIMFLWVAIAANIYFFRKVSKKAAYLLIPYILWVSLALALNLSIYLLN